MEDTLNGRPLIKPEQILRTEKQPLLGLDQLDHHLQTRGNLFFSRLGAINMDKNSFGWHKIEETSKGGFRKISSSPDSESTFTGRNLCNFAAFAIYDALKDRARDVELDVVDFETDLTAEKWDNPDHWIQPWRHFVVKATERKTGNIRYYDPTYRQINHRVAGTIHSIRSEELGQLYKNRNGELIDPKSALSYKEEILETLEGWGLTKEKYQLLMNTL